MVFETRSILAQLATNTRDIMELLNVNNLSIAFDTRDGKTQAVDNISFNVQQGKTLGIVGESGSGKSVSCYALMGLINTPPGHIERGKACLLYTSDAADE